MAGKDMLYMFNSAVESSPQAPYVWGFYVFRTTYKDQDLWGKYMEHIRRQASQYLSGQERGSDLLPHLDFTVVENSARLDGASGDTVRAIFFEMIRSFPEEGNAASRIPHAEERDEFPRYSYCMYVDNKCLQSFAELDWEKHAQIRQRFKLTDNPENEFIPFCPEAFAIVLDCEPGNEDGFSHYPEDDDAAPESLEDEAEVEMSWVPVECRWLAVFYAELMENLTWNFWEDGFGFCFQGEGNEMRAWRSPPQEEPELGL